MIMHINQQLAPPQIYIATMICQVLPDYLLLTFILFEVLA